MLAMVIAVVLQASPSAPYALDVAPTADLVVTGLGIAIYGGTELAKSSLAPSSCKWCSVNAVDQWGTGALWSNPQAADTASTAIDLALVPALMGFDFALAHGQGSTRIGLEDMLIISESLAIAGAANQVVKFSVGRQRPYAHQRPANSTAVAGPDDNLSFYSGHTTLAFSLLAATGTVAELRGYEHREWIWIIGAPLAAAVPYLRMAANKHYLTDVLTGAVVGGAIGVGVPLLLHGRKSVPVSIGAGTTSGAPMIAFSGTW